MDNLDKLKPEQLAKVQRLVTRYANQNRKEEQAKLFREEEVKSDLDKKLFKEVKDRDVPDSEHKYYEIAKAFYILFYKNLSSSGSITSNLEKVKYKPFVDPIRLMVQQDKVSLKQFRTVYDFLSNNDFWKKNILSTSKLRKQIPTLLIQSNGQSNKNADIGTGAKNVTQDYIEKIKREISGDIPGQR